MNEYIHHLLGLCGENSHPNAINVTLVMIGIALTIKYVYTKKNAK